MTEKELRSNVATWLDEYKGIAEGSDEHKKILNIFNDSGLCTRYKMTVNDAWCATAASVPFIDLGLTDIFPCVECSCSKMIELAKTAGIWVEDDAYVPGIGDLILYDWQDSGAGDNAGNPDHVGIVQTISASTITVIEGNKSDTVDTRDISINGQYIRGFITPDYASASMGESTSNGTSTASKSASTSTASKSASTTSTSTAKLTVDGEIGKKTVTRLQEVLGQTGSNVDGFIDGQPSASKKYWTSVISEACKWTGGSSACVKKLQQLVKDAGHSPGTVDGELGTKTAKAVQSYLIAKGYSCGSTGADGYFGANSAKALQNWLNAQ